MAKNQRQNALNKRIDTGYDRSIAQSDALQGIINNRIGPVAERSDNLFNETLTGLRGLSPRYQDLYNQAQGQGERFNKFGDEISGWARNSISDSDKYRMRGLGVYDEFAKTGGYSDADKRDVMARVASSTPAFYQSLKDQLGTSNVAGGWNPGYGSQTAKLARDAARGSNEAVREGRMGLAESIREGRLSGARGATDSEALLQAQLGKNYLGGMGLAGDQYKNSLLGTGTAADILQGEQGVYDSMRSLYGANPTELMNLLELSQKGIGQEHDITQGYMGRDIENNPREKSWWQYGLDLAVPLGTAALKKYLPKIKDKIPGGPDKNEPTDETTEVDDEPADTGGSSRNRGVTSGGRTPIRFNPSFAEQRKLWYNQ